MSKRNEAIGTVECPTKACSERCDVFRFRERGESEKSVANRRFAGKLYARCPKHGQLGGGAGDSEMQEYILCHASMHARSAGDRPSTPATQTAMQTQTPASSPAKASGPAPAKPSSSTPATTSEAPAKTWGFFS